MSQPNNAGPVREAPRLPGYTCIEPLGEGAMGVVWRARQLSAQRDVALKLLPSAWLGSRDMQLRFEREVEITASLEHPHIARLYDSGLREGGYYYAMQLVEGVPLDAYAARKGLGERAVIECALLVCDAVHHAHLRGVIHRDLKFSNVMVTEAGQPFVLDFGLAKPVAPAAGATMLSVAGEIAGTPQFMSPEQASAEEHLDTRTDVYSLGVMLYRLLTGHFPHEVPGGYLDLLRAITVEEPVRPTRYAKHMARDLEAILLKALARDRNARYATAGDLAADLRRYLAGDPVAARAITPWYVTRTWLRKHRRGVSVAGAVAAALLALGGYSFHRVRAERDIAQMNFSVARSAIWDFFVKIGDRALDGQPGMTGLRLLLLQSARDHYNRLESRASEDVRLLEDHGRLLNVLAEQQFLVRDEAGGEASLKEALALHERVLAAEPTNGWVMIMMALGCDRLARLARDRDDEATAAPLSARALELKEKLYAMFPDSASNIRMLAYSYDQAALDLRRRRMEDAARPLEERSMALKRRLAEIQPENAVTLRMLAHQYGEMAEFYRVVLRDLKRAQELETEAMEIKERLVAASPDEVANQSMLGYACSSLARQHMHLREYDVGRSLEERALAIKQRLLDADPGNPKLTQAVAYSLAELAQYDIKLNHLDAARTRLLEAIRMNRSLVEKDSRSVSYLQGLALSLDRMGDVERRLEHFDPALEQYEESNALLVSLRNRQPRNGPVLEMLVYNRMFRLDVLMDAGRLDAFDAGVAELETLLETAADAVTLSPFHRARIPAMKAWSAAMRGDSETADRLAAEAVRQLREALKPGVVPPESPLEVSAFKPLWGRPDFESLRAPLLSALAGDLMREPAAIPALSATDTERLRDAAGQFVSVEGRILNCGEAVAGSLLFLNFNSGRQGFSAFVRRDQWPSFAPHWGNEPAKSLPGRAVTLHGTIAIQNDRPVMELLWPAQLNFREVANDPTAKESSSKPATASAPVIGWNQAREFMGQMVTVTGRVLAAKNTGRICFLDLSENAYHDFRLPILQEAFRAWDEAPEMRFSGQTIRVTGEVLERRGVPQIEVRDASQIEIVPTL